METCSEVFGKLEKLEELSTIKNNTINGSLVFESLAPFWDYYLQSLGQGSPQYLYPALDKDYSIFDIARAAGAIRGELGINIDMAKAQINFLDRHFNALRIRHTHGIDQLENIQQLLIKNGIKPLMNSGSWHEQKSRVMLEKIFCFSQLDDGIFADNCEKNHFYIEIPKTFSFDEFAMLNIKVKNNWLGHKFDAALGAYLVNNNVKEMVRIYSEVITLDDLHEIRNLYRQKMK